jgi:two-component system response regulator HydG
MAEEPKYSVLLVDHDEAAGRRALSWLRDRGYAAAWVADGEKAANRIAAGPVGALVAEWRAGRVDGMRLLAAARGRNPELCAVLVAEGADLARAAEAITAGAHDVQARPLDLPRLDAVIRRGMAWQRMALEQTDLRRRLDDRFGLGSLAGRSDAMLRVYAAVRHAGPRQEPVLIFGEPGTGRERIAEAVHHSGPRRDGPMVKADCAALAADVIERELFGEGGKGGTLPGRLERADGGTLFLHHVDALSAQAQARLLSWLRTGAAPRMGDEKRIKSDARVLSSTSLPPQELGGAKGVDPELAAMLSALTVEAVPLRQRPEDIPLLSRDLIARHAGTTGESPRELSAAALDVLQRYDWPGNARELENVVEGMLTAARGAGAITVSEIPARIRRAARPARGELRVPIGVPMAAIERAAIEETMRFCDYDKPRCAVMLDIGLRTLYRKLDQYARDDRGE